MGILHELLIAVGVTLLLLIGWAGSFVVREVVHHPLPAMQATHHVHTSHGTISALPSPHG
jgi:hypothetical protein